MEMYVMDCTTDVLDLGKIYVVTGDTASVPDGVWLVDENRLFNGGLSRKYVQSRLSRDCPAIAGRASWLFQQFIKMCCSYAVPYLAARYLVVDTYVVFLKKTKFFDNGRILLSKSKEYHEPYFRCYEQILREPVGREHSFTAHHIPIYRPIMLELLCRIEKHLCQSWYDAIVDNVDENSPSMFSEYETYGHYLENRYTEKLVVRRLKNVQRFRVRSLLQILLSCSGYETIHDYKKPRNDHGVNPQIYKLFVGLVRNKVLKQNIVGAKK